MRRGGWQVFPGAARGAAQEQAAVAAYSALTEYLQEYRNLA